MNTAIHFFYIRYDYFKRYSLIVCKTVLMLQILIASSCREAPAWKKHVNIDTLDSLHNIALLHHVVMYNPAIAQKFQFSAEGIPEDSTNSWAYVFVELCEKNGVIAAFFHPEAQKSDWVLHFNRELNCQEGIIISRFEEIKDSYQNSSKPLKLKQIKAGCVWYSDFTTRGNFVEDLLEIKADEVFHNY